MDIIHKIRMYILKKQIEYNQNRLEYEQRMSNLKIEQANLECKKMEQEALIENVKSDKSKAEANANKYIF